MSANKENVILIQYLSCFKHFGLLRNKRQIEDFKYISGHFFKMATDIIVHCLWVDFDSILGCLLVLKSEKMDTKKHSKNIPAKKACGPQRAAAGNPGMDPVVP